MIHLSVSDSCRNNCTISLYPKLPITTGARTTLIFQKFLFHFSTWHHHDTYVIGHMTLGVEHTAWNYQSLSSRPPSTKIPPRDHTSPALLYSKKNILTTNHDGRNKNTISNRIPPPNITNNYDPINITAFFNKILRIPSAMTSSRSCQTA